MRSPRPPDAGGAGLGLAIAQEIAHGHDGTLTAGEAPGCGARFTLTMRGRRNENASHRVMGGARLW
ncbi:ATP-binding protein [Kribbella sp. C-35]|uniref:ATP-binding protein n=1 Tax=Kribbella sp. C-35 TaxID=2789276 RepID=UPI00397E0F7E